MIEKALSGSNRYWGLIGVLLVFMTLGAISYVVQFTYGLGATGMSRDVTWGVYIAQFTFLVGVAASGVMVVLPYYLHNYKKFGKLTILGEFLAVAAVSMCLMFIIADLGQPLRALNVLLYPTPNSILFWDMIVLNVYLMLNILVGWVALTCEKKEMPPPKWIKPFVYISIPWAASIHTVTAFLYAGLPGRHFWLTAIMAPRFLASAFAGGPALLIILCMILRKYTKFDAGREAIGKLVTIVTYAAIINLFFVAMEFFTAYYSNIPGHKHTLDYLFFGTGQLVPWMRFSMAGVSVAIVMLLIPALRRHDGWLAGACGLLFVSLWIDKGIGLVIGGFVPNMLEEYTAYYPTLVEILVTLGIWSAGFLVLTVLYKIAITVKEEKMAS